MLARHVDLTAAQYHADPCDVPSLSSHIANIILRQSPLHAWWAHPRLNRDYRSAESDVFDYGRAAHAMLLERDGGGLEVVDADDWRTKAAREARDAARDAGKTPILARQFAKVEAMVLSAAAAYDLDCGHAEHTLIWQEGETRLRSRLDWLSHDRLTFLDYKSTTNASPDYLCARVMTQLGYDVQAAFYRRAVRAVYGTEPAVVFLFQETEPPHCCSLVSLSPAMWAIADSKVQRAIDTWARCMKDGRWPAYSTEIHYAEPTAWQLAEHEARETT